MFSALHKRNLNASDTKISEAPTLIWKEDHSKSLHSVQGFHLTGLIGRNSGVAFAPSRKSVPERSRYHYSRLGRNDGE